MTSARFPPRRQVMIFNGWRTPAARRGGRRSGLGTKRSRHCCAGPTGDCVGDNSPHESNLGRPLSWLAAQGPTWFVQRSALPPSSSILWRLATAISLTNEEHLHRPSLGQCSHQLRSGEPRTLLSVTRGSLGADAHRSVGLGRACRSCGAPPTPPTRLSATADKGGSLRASPTHRHCSTPAVRTATNA